MPCNVALSKETVKSSCEGLQPNRACTKSTGHYVTANGREIHYCKSVLLALKGLKTKKCSCTSLQRPSQRAKERRCKDKCLAVFPHALKSTYAIAPPG